MLFNEAVSRIVNQAFVWFTTSGVQIVVIFFTLFILLHFLKRGIKKLRDVIQGSLPSHAQQKRADTLTSVIRDVVRSLILGMGGLMILSEIGIDMKPLLAAAGVGGLAIGFGAQNLVKDVISGFFILLENQVRVGDVVEIAGSAGLVEEVRLRTIIMRDLGGHVHIVPNGSVDKVKNLTYGFSFALFEFGVAYRENVDHVMKVIKEVASELKADTDFSPDILEPLEMLGVDQLADSAVVIKCRIKTVPIKQWRVAREMNRRIKKAFDARGIEIPFPHQTIYWGEPQAGQHQTLHVAQEPAAS